MASNFLEKFQGKMTTISKLGLQNLFKSNEESLIYTNTIKSFTNKKTVRPLDIRHGTEELKKPESIEISDDKRSLHLPALEERYRSQEQRHHPGRLVHRDIPGHIDKETNWFIEDNMRSATPISKHNSTTDKLITQKENIQKRDSSKQKNLNRNNSSSKISKSGGLGANIGGQEWQLRRSKQEKALNYAKSLRKVHQGRVKHEHEEPAFLTFNGRNITMQ